MRPIRRGYCAHHMPTTHIGKNTVFLTTMGEAAPPHARVSQGLLVAHWPHFFLNRKGFTFWHLHVKSARSAGKGRAVRQKWRQSKPTDSAARTISWPKRWRIICRSCGQQGIPQARWFHVLSGESHAGLANRHTENCRPILHRR